MGGPKKGQLKETRLGCKCEEQRLAKEAQEHLKRLKHSKAMKSFDRYSIVNQDLQQATFANYRPVNQSQREALEDAQSYVSKFDPNVLQGQKYDPDRHPVMNLYFSGEPGLGKSHLAVSIANAVMEKGYPAVFISVPKLLRKIRNTYSKNSELSEDELFAALEDIPLLMLDDIGVENRNDWVEEKLFDLIDNRQGKHTIYTSNISAEQLLDKQQGYGNRDGSRILNRATSPIPLEGNNYRIQELIHHG